MRKAFTIIELLVAIGILAVVLSFANVIFKVSIGAYRTAIANAEIMQKLRAITNQLNTDFKGLRKDGEIFVVWVAAQKTNTNPNDPQSYERFDRIIFFADVIFNLMVLTRLFAVIPQESVICLLRGAILKRRFRTEPSECLRETCIY